MFYVQPTYHSPSTINTTTVVTSSSQTNSLTSVAASTLSADVQNVINQNVSQGIATSVLITDATTGAVVIDYNTGTEHFAASVNKVPIAQSVVDKLRAGGISLNTKITWQRTDRRAGAGIYDKSGAKTSATVQELLKDMLNRSGNTAARVLVNYVLGGPTATNLIWKNTYNLQNTYLIVVSEADKTFYFGNTTAKESMSMMLKLTSIQDTYGQLVTNYMQTNTWTQMGVRSQLGGRADLVLVNKIGSLDDTDGNNRHDVGILTNTTTGKKYNYSMLTTSHTSSSTTQADNSLKQIGSYLISDSDL